MTPTTKRRSWMSTALATTLAMTTGCGAVSLKGLVRTESGESVSNDDAQTRPLANAPQAESANPGPAAAASNQAAQPAEPQPDYSAIFATVSEEDNKKLARDFKSMLRMGTLAKLFKDDTAFSKVEAICGTKVWDQCQIVYESTADELGWQRWTFKRRDASEVYIYPNMFFDIAESKWADKTIHMLRISPNPAVYIGMVQDKCGDPLDAGCEVRAYGSNEHSFRLTVRDSGEVIEVMDTLREWEADL